jgi:hypothetical protein
MKKYRISKLKLYEILKPAIQSKPSSQIKENIDRLKGLL